MYLGIIHIIPGVHDDPSLSGLDVGRVPEPPVVEGQHVVAEASQELARGDS